MIPNFKDFQINEISTSSKPTAGKQNMLDNYTEMQEAIHSALNYLYAGKKLGGGEFLEEIAMAETMLGTHPQTLRYGHGDRGIFQLNSVGFNETKNIKSHPGLKKYHAALKKKGIDWAKINVDDTNNYVYGAIAARLLLLTIPARIPSTLSGRAQQWKKYYNTSLGKGTAALYIQRVKYCKNYLDRLRLQGTPDSIS